MLCWWLLASRKVITARKVKVLMVLCCGQVVSTGALRNGSRLARADLWHICDAVSNSLACDDESLPAPRPSVGIDALWARGCRLLSRASGLLPGNKFCKRWVWIEKWVTFFKNWRYQNDSQSDESLAIPQESLAGCLKEILRCARGGVLLKRIGTFVLLTMTSHIFYNKPLCFLQ